MDDFAHSFYDTVRKHCTSNDQYHLFAIEGSERRHSWHIPVLLLQNTCAAIITDDDDELVKMMIDNINDDTFSPLTR